MDPTQRFSDRVEDYLRYRPGYPDDVWQKLGLDPGARVADVGSGTGLLSRLFLDHGHEVWGVEPNPEMRAAGEAELRGYPRFHSCAGRSEATGLPTQAFDLVVAGQAFHWFEPQATRREFQRITRAGEVALIWNDRNLDTAFERDYAALMVELAPDYAEVRAGRSDARVVEDFFAPARPRTATCPNQQSFDQTALLGRFLSSSCVNAPRAQVERRCAALFERHQREGRVTLTYLTRLHWGRLGPS